MRVQEIETGSSESYKMPVASGCSSPANRYQAFHVHSILLPVSQLMFCTFARRFFVIAVACPQSGCWLSAIKEVCIICEPNPKKTMHDI